MTCALFSSRTWSSTFNHSRKLRIIRLLQRPMEKTAPAQTHTCLSPAVFQDVILSPTDALKLNSNAFQKNSNVLNAEQVRFSLSVCGESAARGFFSILEKKKKADSTPCFHNNRQSFELTCCSSLCALLCVLRGTKTTAYFWRKKKLV